MVPVLIIKHYANPDITHTKAIKHDFISLILIFGGEGFFGEFAGFDFVVEMAD